MAELKTTTDYRALVCSGFPDPEATVPKLCSDIDTLLTENQKMREALTDMTVASDLHWIRQRAREALKTVNAERTDSDAQT